MQLPISETWLCSPILPDMEAHCSTQMGIDDLEGTLLLKNLGANRVVLSREVEIEKIVEVPVEKELVDDLELIAVITAAIAASEGKDPRQYIVRSIKKVHRNQW